jgi:putative NIF3 family GTP cyclohydrolase 1 type 2
MRISIKNIIDFLTTPVILIENTVDKLDFGNPDAIVTGVATTFLATQEVIEKAKTLGVNLIISHEGIFYSHRYNPKITEDNSVYQKKCQTIEDSGMAIFRYHDYTHRYVPDVITAGLLKALGWENYEVENKQIASILEIPEMTVQDIIAHVKKELGISNIRYIGDLTMPCKRVGILVGYRGSGETTIPLLEKENLDMVIYGEGAEWETPEYIRDAVYQGKNSSLIVLGHAESEAAAMNYLAQKLQEEFPNVPTHFIAETPIFKIL